jgi:lysophospholipase L1-like esterase
MKRISRFAAVILLAAAAYAQQKQTALLSNDDALKLFSRVVQLIESTGIAVPGLARAGAPVLENTRQALTNIEQARVQQNSALIYTFLTDARSYLSLADSVPKPYPFPEQARKQFAELRESAERVETHLQALLERKEAELRNPDRDNLGRYAEANEKLPPPASNLPRVVFLGDSITDGWRLNEYFPGRDFVNRGISGQITGEMLGRMKADVVNLQPRAVLILAGTNDIARGVPVKTIENNLEMIADLAEFHNIKAMFASILPVSDYHKDVNPRFEMTKVRPPRTIAEINNWLQRLCEERHLLYVDYYSAMVDRSGMLKSEYADDGLHPNSTGYRIMAPVALEAIGRVVTATEPSGKRKRRLF